MWDPIYVSKETGKIIDGNHRLKIANELGMDNIPVKYVKSSEDFDLNNERWYSLVEENINEKGTRNERIDQINEGSQDERIDNNGGSTSSKNTRGYRKNSKIYSEEQGTNNRPSTKTIYGSDSDLGQRELDNSSFSLEV